MSADGSRARRLPTQAGDAHSATLLGVLLLLHLGLAATLGARFFDLTNLQSMSIQMAVFGFLALAMALSMLTGGIDLSIVSTAALSGITGAYAMSGSLGLDGAGEGTLLLYGVAVTLVTGLLCGVVNGLLIAKVGVPPILATLATMIFYAGIGAAVTSGSSVAVKGQLLSRIGQLTVASVPLLFVVLIGAFVVAGYALQRRVLGRFVYLLGESPAVMTFSGVRHERITVSIYAFCGLLSGIAGVVTLSVVNSARVGFGESYLLQAILVVVLAGFDPFGGRGRVLNLAVGIVLLQSLQSAFSSYGFSPFAKDLVWGLLLLVVIVNAPAVGRFRPWRRRAGTAPVPGADPVPSLSGGK